MANFLFDNKVDSICKRFTDIDRTQYFFPSHNQAVKPLCQSNCAYSQTTIKNSKRYFTVNPHIHVFSNAPNGGKIQLEFNQRHEQQHFFKG